MATHPPTHPPRAPAIQRSDSFMSSIMVDSPRISLSEGFAPSPQLHPHASPQLSPHDPFEPDVVGPLPLAEGAPRAPRAWRPPPLSVPAVPNTGAPNTSLVGANGGGDRRRPQQRSEAEYHALLQSAGLQVRVKRTGGGYRDQPYTADELLERAAQLGEQVRVLTAEKDEQMATLREERAARAEAELAGGTHQSQLAKLQAERGAMLDMLREAAHWKAATTDELGRHVSRQAELEAALAQQSADADAWRAACQAAKLAVAEMQAELDSMRSVGTRGQERIEALQRAMGAEDEHLALLSRRLSAQRDASFKLLSVLPTPPTEMPSVAGMGAGASTGDGADAGVGGAASTTTMPELSLPNAFAHLDGPGGGDSPTAAASASASAAAATALAAATLAVAAAPAAACTVLGSPSTPGGSSSIPSEGGLASSSAADARAMAESSPAAKEAQGTLTNLADGVQRARGWVKFGHRWHGHAIDLAQAVKVLDARLHELHARLEEAEMAKAAAEIESEGVKAELAEANETLQRSALELADLRLQTVEARAAVRGMEQQMLLGNGEASLHPHPALAGGGGRAAPGASHAAALCSSDSHNAGHASTAHAAVTHAAVAHAAAAHAAAGPTAAGPTAAATHAAAANGPATSLQSLSPPISPPPSASQQAQPPRPAPWETTVPAAAAAIGSMPAAEATCSPSTNASVCASAQTSPTGHGSSGGNEGGNEGGAASSASHRHASIANRWVAEEAMRRYEAMLQEVGDLRVLTHALQAELQAASASVAATELAKSASFEREESLRREAETLRQVAAAALSAELKARPVALPPTPRSGASATSPPRRSQLPRSAPSPRSADLSFVAEVATANLRSMHHLARPAPPPPAAPIAQPVPPPPPPPPPPSTPPPDPPRNFETPSHVVPGDPWTSWAMGQSASKAAPVEAPSPASLLRASAPSQPPAKAAGGAPPSSLEQQRDARRRIYEQLKQSRLVKEERRQAW